MFDFGSWLTGIGDNVKQFNQQNPDALAVGLDMMGKNLDPHNAFAGVGTMIGQGKIADRQAKAQQEGQTNMIQAIAKMLTGKDQSGPTTLTFNKNDQGSLEYTMKGMETAGTSMQPQAGPQTSIPAPGTNPIEQLGYKPSGGM